MLELLGRGGAASVYRARDESLGRDVAVKIFDESATSEKDIRRQQDEVNLLASLNHHSLVTLLDAGVDRAETERPRVYFVMELAAGADLKQKIEHGPLSPRHVAQIGYDVAEGVEYLHHKGVVHRDIKPANILLADYSIDGIRERAKLTDFGIALVRGNDRADTENFTTGTAAYLSPEQVRGQELDSASDIYSLGLVLLECFTGVTAFPGQPVASALARLQSDPSIPHRLDPEWSGLLAAMTAQDASDRPSIKEIVLALHQMIVAETGRHRAAGDFIKPNEVA
ncbi:serine/threonine-protein kinase [Cryobacterium algoricola]|nr:serine/threonine-protein kinase [Cryobacterium algoricola]